MRLGSALETPCAIPREPRDTPRHTPLAVVNTSARMNVRNGEPPAKSGKDKAES